MKQMLVVILLAILTHSLQAAECIGNLSRASVCSANDFTIDKEAINNSPTSCFEGDIVPPFTLRLTVDSTATI